MRRSLVLSSLSAVTAVTACLWAASPVMANDSALGGVGGAVRPITVADIRMESEAVQIVAFSRYAAVRVDFRFVNSGRERKVKLGFPFELPYEKADPSDLPAAAAFHAWQDGLPLDVTWTGRSRVGAGTAGIPVGYFVHEATFKPGVTMIRVEYLAEPNSQVPTPDIPDPPDRYKGVMSSKASYEYWVHTGAGWAGTIGRSVVSFRLSPDFQGWGIDAAQRMAATEPGLPKGGDDILLGYKRPDASTYEWIFSDYEPTIVKGGVLSKYDVSLHYFQPNWYRQNYKEAGPSEWTPDRVVKAQASSRLKLGEYEYPAEAAFAGLTWAWAEGVPGPGAGEWVKATFAGRRHISEIRVLPGYAKSPALFRKYNRPKTLTVAFSDGTSKLIRLADDPTLQRFPVSTDATWAKVTLGGVYRGTTRDETYISMLDFGATSRGFASFEQVTGEKQGGAAPAEATSSGLDGAPSPPASPATGRAAIVAAAGVVAVAIGVILIAGGIWLFVRMRRPRE